MSFTDTEGRRTALILNSCRKPKPENSFQILIFPMESVNTWLSYYFFNQLDLANQKKKRIQNGSITQSFIFI